MISRSSAWLRTTRVFRFDDGQTSRTTPRSRSMAITRTSRVLLMPCPMRVGSSASTASRTSSGPPVSPAWTVTPSPARAHLGEQVAVVGEAEAGRLRAGDVHRHHAAVPPGDGLGGDDLVQLVLEGAVQAEDEARPHLRVFEHGPIHAAHRRGDDVVQVLLAAAVALHRVEAQLQAGDVVLAVGAADDLVHAALDGGGAGLDQLGPVEEVEVGLEGAAPAADGDQVPELPVVLGRQPDALGVGDAPHDGRRDRRAQVDVQLGQGSGGVKRRPRHESWRSGCGCGGV